MVDSSFCLCSHIKEAFMFGTQQLVRVPQWMGVVEVDTSCSVCTDMSTILGHTTVAQPAAIEYNVHANPEDTLHIKIHFKSTFICTCN